MRSIVCAVLVLAAAACGGEVRDGGAEAAAPRAAKSPLLALVSTGTHATLRRLDRTTLAATGEQSLFVGLHDLPWSYSPDGSRLVLGSGRTSSVIVVDTKTLRRLGTVPAEGFVSALTWPRDDTVILIENFRQERLHARLIDPAGLRVRRSVRLASRRSVLGAGRVDGGLVLLLGGVTEIRPAELVVVGADGRVSRRILEVEAGFVPAVSDDDVAEHRTPALAVSPDRRRAVVVPPTGPVALVDLESMDVTYHPLSDAASWLGSLRAWLDPIAEAKGPVDARNRVARWVDAGVLVAGSDVAPDEAQSETTAGLFLIDPETWTRRPVDAEASSLITYDRYAVAFGTGLPALLQLDDDGVTLRRRLPERGSVAIAGGYAYVGLDHEYRPHRVAVVDLAGGQVLARPRVPGWVHLLDAARPEICWCYADP